MPETDSQPVEVPARHEAKDIDARGVWLSGAIVFATVVGSMLAAWWLFDHLAARERHPRGSLWPLAEGRRLPPEPRLEGLEGQTGSVSDRSTVQPQLDSYGWVDRQAGVVRIPIDRAMHIIAGQIQSSGQPETNRAVRPSAANSGRGSFEDKP